MDVLEQQPEALGSVACTGHDTGVVGLRQQYDVGVVAEVEGCQLRVTVDEIFLEGGVEASAIDKAGIPVRVRAGTVTGRSIEPLRGPPRARQVSAQDPDSTGQDPTDPPRRPRASP